MFVAVLVAVAAALLHLAATRLLEEFDLVVWS